MADNVKKLEELVTRTVDRLRGLSEEKGALRQEVDQLNERLDVLERDASHLERGEDEEKVWQAERREAVSLLNQTLSELRGE